MFGQTFEITDLIKLLFVSLSELFLVADNTIVIALLIRQLAKKERKPALIIGIVSAAVLRLIALIFIQDLITAYWIRILGAIFLFYISIRYFLHERKTPIVNPRPKLSRFILVICLIEMIDMAFAVDSIYSALAFVGPDTTLDSVNPKIWIIYVGSIFGLVTIRYAAELVTKLIDWFPHIEDSMHLMISWIGFWLLITSLSSIYSWSFTEWPYIQFSFWTGLFMILTTSVLFHKSKVRHE